MSSIVSVAVGIFTLIANVKALADYASQFAAAIMAWYVSKAKADTLSAIADAAAFASQAQTDEELYQAAEKWKVALSRPRVS